MKWTIDISFGDDDGESQAKVTAVIQVDSDGSVQVVELTLRAGEGGEIPALAARNIDFEMLARALSGAAATTRNGAEKGSRREPSKALRNVAQVKDRPYRRMPDAEDVKEVFLRTGSVGKLAQHYAVPRYTAQAWVDRLRRAGSLQA